MAERTIREVKKFIACYPTFVVGWKCALEAAIKHHNRSYTKGIGCCPNFAISNQPTILQADEILKIHDKIILSENKLSQEAISKYRVDMKKNFDSRKGGYQSTDIKVDSKIFVWKGVAPGRKIYGPFLVRKVI